MYCRIPYTLKKIFQKRFFILQPFPHRGWRLCVSLWPRFFCVSGVKVVKCRGTFLRLLYDSKIKFLPIFHMQIFVPWKNPKNQFLAHKIFFEHKSSDISLYFVQITFETVCSLFQCLIFRTHGCEAFCSILGHFARFGPRIRFEPVLRFEQTDCEALFCHKVFGRFLGVYFGFIYRVSFHIS